MNQIKYGHPELLEGSLSFQLYLDEIALSVPSVVALEGTELDPSTLLRYAMLLVTSGVKKVLVTKLQLGNVPLYPEAPASPLCRWEALCQIDRPGITKSKDPSTSSP